jgi:hypothetical protein
MDKRRLVRARGESRERDVGQGRTTPDDADFAGCSPRTPPKTVAVPSRKKWVQPGGNCWPVQPVRIVHAWSSKGRRGKLTQADGRRGVARLAFRSRGITPH